MKMLTKLTNHPVHLIDEEAQMFPTALLPFCEVDGEFVGGIGVHPQDDIQRLNAELGYWLAEHLWGKGIMTEAIRRMVKYAFENFEIDRIFARPFGSNVASQKALEKAGFTFEARFEKTLIKNGEKQDEIFYAIRRM